MLEKKIVLEKFCDIKIVTPNKTFSAILPVCYNYFKYPIMLLVVAVIDRSKRFHILLFY